jgi:ubiquinone/menaquinone biosynthesis C-methylase UbiE
MKALLKRNLLPLLQRVGWTQSEARMISDAQQYWRQNSAKHSLHSHWRSAMEPGSWEALGQFHRELFDGFFPECRGPRRMPRMIEWGCGGGANAIAFADLVEEFIGVDISAESLEECGRQLSGYDLRYTSQIVTAAQPELVLDSLKNPVDFFLCTFVFELLPTEGVGKQILKVAHQCLRDGGVAMIQVKYATSDPATRSRQFAYHRHLANTTTFRIEQFWELACQSGFLPRCVHLLPKAPLVQDERYAYFFLDRSKDIPGSLLDA